MTKTFKFFLRKPGKSKALMDLRERLLKIMLLSSFAVGTVLFGFALIPVLQKGLYPTILVYSLLYVWIILITFVQRLPYGLRAIGWLGIFYVIGNINLFLSGFNVDAGLVFITFIAMTILLMDLPAGLVALVLGSISISILGIVNVTEHHELSIGLSQSNPLLWTIGGIIFLLMGILLIYSLTIVINGLEENLEKTLRLADELEQTNQALRTSEARYRTLVEISPGLVALLDTDGNILMANQVGLTLFGYEASEEMAGKNILAFIAPEDQSRVEKSFQRTLRGGPPNDLECLALRKDGAKFNAEFNGTLITDEAGKPQAVICIGKDITERKEAEQILREAKEALAEKVAETTVQLKQTTGRLEELVKHGPTVIYSYRASGEHTITYISENAVALFGYEASELMEDGNFWEHVHPEDKERIFALSEQVKDKERVVCEYRFL